jgi:hypothetical protein
MTVSTATATATLAWTGVETTFNPGFQAQNVGDVSVTSVAPGGEQTLLTLGTHYSLTLDGSGNVTAAPITLPAAPGNLLIVRNSSLLQADSFADGKPSRAAATNPARASELRAADADAAHAAAAAADAAASGEPPLIAASIPDGLDALAAIAEERAEIAGSATPAIDAGAEALAVDLIDSIDNIVKKLAEAWLAIREPLGAVAKTTAAEFVDGLLDELPKQSKKLGKLMARIAVWGPMVAGAGFLAGHFAWFAPIAKLLMRAFVE